jgi:hypothetical protein
MANAGSAQPMWKAVQNPDAVRGSRHRDLNKELLNILSAAESCHLL